MNDDLKAVRDAAHRYQANVRKGQALRRELLRAIAAALAAGERPTDVAKRSGFTGAYVRRIARAAGIGPRHAS
jgi:hypothetical protein